jgi:hypothetical protein
MPDQAQSMTKGLPNEAGVPRPNSPPQRLSRGVLRTPGDPLPGSALAPRRLALLSASSCPFSACTTRSSRRWQIAQTARNAEHMPNMVDSGKLDTCAATQATGEELDLSSMEGWGQAREASADKHGGIECLRPTRLAPVIVEDIAIVHPYAQVPKTHWGRRKFKASICAR